MLAASAAALVPASASAADLVTNGGFEDPYITNACCNTVPADALPGWKVESGNVNVVNGTFASSAGNLAFAGEQYLDLVGQGGIGSISQIVSTVAGQAYTLTFAFSHNLFSGLASASASFAIEGLNGIITHVGGSNANLNWVTYSGSFVASGSSATLNFTNLTGAGNEGIFLDAVSISAAVPEPSVWFTMLLGFGALGGAMRAARRKQVALAHA
jgi:hypothetical protein